MMYLMTLWLIWYLMGVSVARMGYLKDQSMNAVFPGPVYRQHQNLPEGHLRPLGWQRRPDAPIPEEMEIPGSREFYEKYVSQDNPVVFREALLEAPVFSTWSDDRYLTDKYGHLNVTVRVKIARAMSKIISAEEMIKFKKFLSDYMYDDLYLAGIVPSEMMPELPLPKCVRCGTISESLISAQMWMSSGGTSSRVHSHDNHLLHCVLFGRRDFILIEDVYKHSFAYHNEYHGSMGGYSDMDTERVNVIDFKRILRVPWIWATLYPGECLYVPAGYLHQVRSYGRSVSLTIEFSPISDFDDSGCQLIEKEFVPLSDAYFLLTFENGRTRLHDLELDAEKVRHMLLSLVEKNGVLRIEKFEYFYNQVVGEGTLIPSARSVFDLLSSGKMDTKLTRIEILNVAEATLQKIVDIINKVYADIPKRARATKVEKADLSTDLSTDETDESTHEEF